MSELVIGCVGKPSAGKSTFFNAVTEGKAKVGNFPFTTIEPNIGVSYYRVECPCKKKNLSHLCRPRYGKCENGLRYIPIKLLDVAGLIPGASEGAGLGNKFLDDLRHAHVLMHIIDVSGTTNEKGESTTGYDPINDAEWLENEIKAWIFQNLWKKWDGIVRKHTVNKAKATETFSAQLSGYGTPPSMIAQVLDKLKVKDPVDLKAWDREKVEEFVEAFLSVRFPIILVLNKADQGGDTDRNIERLADRFGDTCFVSSAAAEFFLKNAARQKFIKYSPGDFAFTTKEEEEEESKESGEACTLLQPDAKVLRRLSRLRDLVLYRYGSTGVWQALEAAVKKSNVIVVYPVRSLTKFTTDTKTSGSHTNSSSSNSSSCQSGSSSSSSSSSNSASSNNDGSTSARDSSSIDTGRSSSSSGGNDGQTGGGGNQHASDGPCENESKEGVRGTTTTTTCSSSSGGGGGGGSVFGSAILVKKGTTVKELAYAIDAGVGHNFAYAEAEDGRKLGENDILHDGQILKINTVATKNSAASQS